MVVMEQRAEAGTEFSINYYGISNKDSDKHTTHNFLNL